jgi:hypothetical protein
MFANPRLSYHASLHCTRAKEPTNQSKGPSFQRRAVIGALSPVPYVTSYGTWVAILAYVVLAIGNLVST